MHHVAERLLCSSHLHDVEDEIAGEQTGAFWGFLRLGRRNVHICQLWGPRSMIRILFESARLCQANFLSSMMTSSAPPGGAVRRGGIAPTPGFRQAARWILLRNLKRF